VASRVPGESVHGSGTLNGSVGVRGRGRKRRDTIGQASHGAGKVARDGVSAIGISPKEHHYEKNIGASREEVYQKVLVDPVDLSQQAPDAVSLHTRSNPASGRKSNLKRHIISDLLRRRRSKQQPDTADGDGFHILTRPVEKRPDQTLSLQAMRAGKRQARRPVGVVSHVPGLAGR